jgi:hypothetical protein
MVIADIESDLLTYADFEEVASVSRAKSFITAAKRWLILRAESASNQSSSLSIGKNYVEAMLKRAQDFVAANPAANGSGGGSVRFLGAGANFR